ncbi:hypothetical protein IAE22_34385, partial [Bacillus sp. S34]|nr:hypothetical protein [Bacillus sp. S34]
PDDTAIDHDEEDEFRMVEPPADIAFPPVTSDFADGFAAHVASVPPRWRIGAAVSCRAVPTGQAASARNVRSASRSASSRPDRSTNRTTSNP